MTSYFLTVLYFSADFEVVSNSIYFKAPQINNPFDFGFHNNFNYTLFKEIFIMFLGQQSQISSKASSFRFPESATSTHIIFVSAIYHQFEGATVL